MKNILIMGCSRSGTSIFGELFQNIDGLRYVWEPILDKIPPVAGATVMKSPTMEATYQGRIDQLTPGLAFNVDTMLRVLPEPAVIWLVRHPLDTICSLRPGIADDWHHHPRPPNWRAWKTKPLVEQCARHWRFINETGRAEIRPEPVITIRYEDLVSNPVDTGYVALTAAGISANAAKDAVAKWAPGVSPDKGGYEADMQTRWSRNDHSRRIGRWRENLSNEETDICWSVLGDSPLTYGYDMC